MLFRFWIWIIELNFFHFFFFFPHLSSLSLIFSFISLLYLSFAFYLLSCCYLFIFLCIVLLQSWPATLSYYCLLTLSYCLGLLPHHTTLCTTSLVHHVTLLPHLVASSHYLIASRLLPPTSSCYHHSLFYYLTSLPRYLEVPSNTPAPPNLLLCCLAILCLATSLPCVGQYFLLPSYFVALCWLVLPSSLLFCKEELRAWRSKLSNNHHKRWILF